MRSEGVDGAGEELWLFSKHGILTGVVLANGLHIPLL